MPAREVATQDQVEAWVVAEATVAGWGAIQPYSGRNQQGCPDVTLARDGSTIFVWMRSHADPAPTGKQRSWMGRLLGDADLSPDQPAARGAACGYGTVDGYALWGLLLWPSDDGRPLEIARRVISAPDLTGSPW